MAKNSFEIGMVYRKLHRVFLSIDENTLIYYEDGEWIKKKPYNKNKYWADRDFMVCTLINRWGVSMAEFDAMSRRELHKRMAKPSDASPSYRTAQRRQEERVRRHGYEAESGRLHRVVLERKFLP